MRVSSSSRLRPPYSAGSRRPSTSRFAPLRTSIRTRATLGQPAPVGDTWPTDAAELAERLGRRRRAPAPVADAHRAAVHGRGDAGPACRLPRRGVRPGAAVRLVAHRERAFVRHHRRRHGRADDAAAALELVFEMTLRRRGALVAAELRTRGPGTQGFISIRVL